jgi:hypothetical protein
MFVLFAAKQTSAYIGNFLRSQLLPTHLYWKKWPQSHHIDCIVFYVGWLHKIIRKDKEKRHDHRFRPLLLMYRIAAFSPPSTRNPQRHEKNRTMTFFTE